METAPSRDSHRYAAWTRPNGRVEVSFWTTLSGSHLEPTDVENTTSTRGSFNAKVIVIPKPLTASRALVMFDFTPHLDLSAKITYSAMIPNGSEIFRIVGGDQVEELAHALQEGTARLTDRDEDGRSLLSVSCHAVLSK